MTRNLAFLCLLAVTLTVGTLPTVAADPSHDVHITATAMEDGCPDDKTYCWELEMQGTPEPGAVVKITAVNPSENRETHNLYVKFNETREEGRNTQGDTADVNTADLAPGEEEAITFTIPSDASSAYLWCDIGVHESPLGMWEQWDFEDQADGGDGGTGGDGGDGTDGGQESPAPGLLAALAGLGLAAFALRRRG